MREVRSSGTCTHIRSVVSVYGNTSFIIILYIRIFLYKCMTQEEGVEKMCVPVAALLSELSELSELNTGESIPIPMMYQILGK